jgi:CDP-glucose 4,6-dehydratase
MAFADAFRRQRVLVTGHTGFKGAWLCEWLLSLGANITGLALPPATNPSLFEQLGLSDRLDHRIADIRDPIATARIVAEVQPDFVFHLAAQPLVRLSYALPVDTYATNLSGTLHVLEALRPLTRACAAVFVTTDKCYENRETGHGYREEDPLGGHDPYSSSKAACEIAIASWRRSFFRDHSVRIASARAGNVIGGGDWAADRILPDSVRALAAGAPVAVRNPGAVRPWQHVLEPLSGYLWLAASLAGAANDRSAPLSSAFNFGPPPEASRTVEDVVEETLKHWPGRWETQRASGAVHEAQVLHLSIEKARRDLDWEPVWDFARTVERTIAWYRDTGASGTDARGRTQSQISDYVAAARQRKLPWSQS